MTFMNVWTDDEMCVFLRIEAIVTFDDGNDIIKITAMDGNKYLYYDGIDKFLKLLYSEE
ncbi:hypothetical protein [Sulfurovum sp.]|uniref:hypothetical protein n=1 Tax=Sulfurovum sp. TaxID=1969726 RepID=UPI00356470D4